MPQLPIVDDRCRTAADVRTQCGQTIGVRKLGRKLLPVPSVAAEPRGELRDVLPAQLSPRERQVQDVIDFACGYFGVDRSVIKDEARLKENLNPRYTAVYLVREVVGITFHEIGAIVRARTIAIDSYYTAERLLKVDPEHPVSKAVRAGFKRFGIMSDLLPPEANDKVEVAPPTIKCVDIIKMTAKYFNRTVVELMSPLRTHELLLPRHMAIYLCLKSTLRSTTYVGRLLNRDHSTVIHANQRIEAEINANNPVIVRDVENLKSAIAGGELVERPPPPKLLHVPPEKKGPFGRQEIALLKEMVRRGDGYRAMAKATGRSKSAVATKLSRLGIRHNPAYKRYTEEELGIISRMVLEDKASTKTIAEVLGRDVERLAKKIGQMRLGGYRIRRRVPYSPEDTKKLLELRFSGMTVKQIATTLNRDPGSISDKLHQLRNQQAYGGQDGGLTAEA